VNAPLAHRALAEFAGTGALVGIGTGAIVAAARLGGEPQWIIALAWFAAVAVPVLLFASVSGAHLNPAVSFALVLRRKLPVAELPAYVLAQLGGAFAASAGVLVLLGPSAHLGATVPRDGAIWLIFPLEAAFTAALVLSVLYLVSLPGVPSPLELLLPAGVVGASTFLIGPWTGSSLNPARSIAPAVLSGEYLGLWAYLLILPVAALLTVLGVELLERRRSG
jgi:aquaporin NIP